ncbi:MAG: six-hairpin glycosidase-like protein [Bacteroidota bacterium]
MRLTLILILLTALPVTAQTDRWRIAPNERSIVWDLTQETDLPHSDNIEMSGRGVSMIVDYEVDTNRMISVQRRLIYPQFRVLIKDTDPDWWATYRNYLRENYEDEEVLPKLYVGDREVKIGPVDSIRLNGQVIIHHAVSDYGFKLTRYLYPEHQRNAAHEFWTIKNVSDSSLDLRLQPKETRRFHEGKEDLYISWAKGKNTFRADPLMPGQLHKYAIVFQARSGKVASEISTESIETEHVNRSNISRYLASNRLILETPEPVYNTLFALSKIRGAESIFDSKIGPIHSPGGERYYTGFWANDQAEYINPFFPYLGYDLATKAALNMYRIYADACPDNYDDNIRYSFEMAGDAPVNPLDRGDAAMIAYGLSHYLLALGDRAIAKEFWPFLNWCLEYNHRHRNEAGVVMSESDEMEERIATGEANLSTSSLYYAALETSIALAEDLGKDRQITREWTRRRRALDTAIENYFGAIVEGLETYRYYEGHNRLRHWIALPLVAGIHERAEGTLTGLFDSLWTDNGVHVEKNHPDPRVSEVFWDRGTLYALRGAFMAGATEQAHERLLAFSQKRLLGERVPYVVEAFPEGNMAHLSAESGLYCRVFLEGLFGLMPTGLNSFRLQPRMPEGWDRMALRRVFAFGQTNGFDIDVQREGSSELAISVTTGDRVKVYRAAIGEAVEIEIN